MEVFLEKKKLMKQEKRKKIEMAQGEKIGQ